MLQCIKTVAEVKLNETSFNIYCRGSFFFCVQLVDRELRVDCRFIVIVGIVGHLC
jgi:hypothetical protein